MCTFQTRCLMDKKHVVYTLLDYIGAGKQPNCRIIMPVSILSSQVQKKYGLIAVFLVH